MISLGTPGYVVTNAMNGTVLNVQGLSIIM